MLGWRRRVVTISFGKNEIRGPWQCLFAGGDGLAGGLAGESVPVPPDKNRTRWRHPSNDPFKFLTRNERRFLAHVLGI